MCAARSWHDTLPVTNSSGTGEWLGKEEVAGVFVKTGDLYYLGVLTLQVTLLLFLAPVWLQLGELIISCQ